MHWVSQSLHWHVQNELGVSWLARVHLPAHTKHVDLITNSCYQEPETYVKTNKTSNESLVGGHAEILRNRHIIAELVPAQRTCQGGPKKLISYQGSEIFFQPRRWTLPSRDFWVM